MHPLTLILLTLTLTLTLAAPTSSPHCAVEPGYSPPKSDVKAALAKFLLTCSSNPPKIPPKGSSQSCTEDFVTSGKAAIRVCPGILGGGKDGIVLSCEEIKNGVETLLSGCVKNGDVAGSVDLGGDRDKGYVVVARDYRV